MSSSPAAPPGVPPPPGASPPPPPPPGDGQPQPPLPFWRISLLVIPDADASPASQAITYVVAAFAIGMVAHVASEPGMGIAISLILLLGIVMGLATGATRFFRHAPGTLLGVVASVLTAVSLAFLWGALGLAGTDGRVVAVIVIGAGAFVAGLDWTRVGRLRAIPVLAALPVLVVSAGERGPMLAVSLAWFALAVAALWSLECDQRAAFSDPRPLTPRPQRGRDVDSRDLAGALGLALMIGLLFAFSASMPSCSPNIPGLGRFGFDGPDIGGRDMPFDTDRLSLDDIRFGNFPFDFDGEFPSIDINGVEHLLREGLSGMLYLENTQTGERFPLRMENGNLVARDAAGNVVAVIRPAEEKPPSGSSPPWKTILAAAAGLAVAAAALWWYLRRRKPPPATESRQWAEDLVNRLDRFGRQHSTPRHRSETVVHHVDALTESVAPDPRLPGVARVVSDALFGHEHPTMEQRLWAEQVVDEVIEAHPPPSRIDRLKRRRRSTATDDEPQPTIGRP